MERFYLEWCTADSSEVARPLVVLFPWVWAGSNYVKKYVRLCEHLGWDVLLVNWPMAAMWLPTWSRSLAYSVVEALGNHLQQRGERPVVLYAFSGSAKGILSSVLSLLARQHPLSVQQVAAVASVLRCCAGCIYDSCPVDFTSEAGKRLFAPHIFTASGGVNSSSSSSSQAGHNSSSSRRLVGAAGRLARSAASFASGLGCDVAAGTLDFFLLEWFEKDRAAMWTALRNTPIRGPLLLLYSTSDQLADASQLADLAASLRLKGHTVVEQLWQDTPHCGHYRSHPEHYTDSVSFLLSRAIQEWSGRSSRVREGREWAARWQQDLPEQQQQQQQLDLAGQQQQQQQRQYAGQTVWAGQWASMPLGHQQSQQQYHVTEADDIADTEQQQLQGEVTHAEQQPQLTIQHTRGIMFGGNRRHQQQQQQCSDRTAGGLSSASSSSSSNNLHLCNCSSSSSSSKNMHHCSSSSSSFDSSWSYRAPTSTDVRQTGSLGGSSSSSCSSQEHQQLGFERQQPARAATGCCCSGSVLAAATAAAVADAVDAEMSGAFTTGRACSKTSSSSSSSRGSSYCTHKGVARMQQHLLQRQWQRQQQQQQRRRSTSRDLTSLVMLSHAAATPYASSSKPCSAGAAGVEVGASPADTPAAAVAAAAGVGLSGHALISTCCCCEASECRCAETLAAASGEVVCSDSTTLSHSLRCMTSTYMARQQQQQQRRQQQLQCHSGSSSNISLVSSQNADHMAESVSSENVTGAAGTIGVCQQQQHVQAMHLLHQQQQQPFVQRVVCRLRSKL